MAAKWTNYFKIIDKQVDVSKAYDSQNLSDPGSYNNFSWYQRLIHGSTSRLAKYREYDLMDADVEIFRALDTIGEEMTGNNPKTNEPIEVEVIAENDDRVKSYDVLTVKAALRRWCQLHKWDNRLFKIARHTAKYGDCFFRKQKDYEKWTFIHPKNVMAAIVDSDDINKVIGWQVREDIEKARQGGMNMPLNTGGRDSLTYELIPADEMVWFTLNDDMSDTAPFGESILNAVYKTHKQKELLEDAIIIYRVQRSPERRVFYIDVGKMPPQRVKQYLETIKNEIKQKKIPSINGGQSEVDSVYNPQSMSEDFYFASRPDGRGSKVEVLPGGANLGQLEDLDYFQRKVWRGLKVPASYMIEQQEGGQLWNDGKVGIAYIQELRFALFIVRLQRYIEETLDKEFKIFLRKVGITVDHNLYRLRLPEPSNFGKYRQMELDSQLLGQFGTADSIQYLSKRFALKKYLNLSDQEILINERMLREEKQLDVNGDAKDYPMLYGAGDELGMAGGMGGIGGSPMPMMPGDELGMEGMEGGEGTIPTEEPPPIE